MTMSDVVKAIRAMPKEDRADLVYLISRIGTDEDDGDEADVTMREILEQKPIAWFGKRGYVVTGEGS